MLASNCRVWLCPFQHAMPRPKAVSPVRGRIDSTLRVLMVLRVPCYVLCPVLVHTWNSVLTELGNNLHKKGGQLHTKNLWF